MPGTMTAAMQTAAEATLVRPVVIVRLDIAVDPVYAWNGPGDFSPTGTGDAALDGITFSPADAVADVSEIMQDQGLGGPLTIRASGASLDTAVLRQLVRDRRLYLGLPAYVWLGLLTADEHSVVADPKRIKTGVMTKMSVSRQSAVSTVEIVIDADLSGARGRATRVTDHATFYSTDTWSTYAIRMLTQTGGISGLRGTPVGPGPGAPKGGPSDPTQVLPA